MGRGGFVVNGSFAHAHRVAWMLTNGPIPQGKGHHGTCVCHRCDSPGCCNPAHMFLGSHADNMRDMKEKGRVAHGETHGRAKLTAVQVLEVRQHTEISGREFARRLGVDESNISRIRRRKTWREA